MPGNETPSAFEPVVPAFVILNEGGRHHRHQKALALAHRRARGDSRHGGVHFPRFPPVEIQIRLTPPPASAAVGHFEGGSSASSGHQARLGRRLALYRSSARPGRQQPRLSRRGSSHNRGRGRPRPGPSGSSRDWGGTPRTPRGQAWQPAQCRVSYGQIVKNQRLADRPLLCAILAVLTQNRPPGPPNPPIQARKSTQMAPAPPATAVFSPRRTSAGRRQDILARFVMRSGDRGPRSARLLPPGG